MGYLLCANGNRVTGREDANKEMVLSEERWKKSHMLAETTMK